MPITSYTAYCSIEPGRTFFPDWTIGKKNRGLGGRPAEGSGTTPTWTLLRVRSPPLSLRKRTRSNAWPATPRRLINGAEKKQGVVIAIGYPRTGCGSAMDKNVAIGRWVQGGITDRVAGPAPCTHDHSVTNQKAIAGILRSMKPNFLRPLGIVAILTLLSQSPLRAEEPALRDLLRDALFTEEVTRDPAKAAEVLELVTTESPSILTETLISHLPTLVSETARQWHHLPRVRSLLRAQPDGGWIDHDGHLWWIRASDGNLEFLSPDSIRAALAKIASADDPSFTIRVSTGSQPPRSEEAPILLAVAPVDFGTGLRAETWLRSADLITGNVRRQQTRTLSLPALAMLASIGVM